MCLGDPAGGIVPARPVGQASLKTERCARQRVGGSSDTPVPSQSHCSRPPLGCSVLAQERVLAGVWIHPRVPPSPSPGSYTLCDPPLSVPDCRGKAFGLSSLSTMLAVGFS